VQTPAKESTNAVQIKIKRDSSVKFSAAPIATRDQVDASSGALNRLVVGLTYNLFSGPFDD
jgi:hypothetical protein